ncbi:hypothetical protein KO504_00090 [Winogradskyella psychrotolerans]|uniref:hypothetical protein n=1 Tax=Winogradskyella psychrotolerans TaxID=1344585 RepID=UPI001C06AC89|nr:hypothetical protein [Winogradskyella psychrotolerans]MBU2919724.1 hypothetical protein [Winogradskyella psychrotolerans]
MSEDYNKPTFKKLLDKLQEESWQLELLISGFAIFGLFSAYPNLEIAYQHAQNENNIFFSIVMIVALSACSILIFNLLLHVLLRGLWIGALGLRYVSGDIEYDTLNYSKRFNNYLKRKVGSFDRYIGRLENYCSVIFAISFLLIFYMLAIALTFGAIAFVVTVFLNNHTFSDISTYFGIILLVFLTVGMLLTFIDFITLGFLKKKKWISKLYFPIYWCFSIITLSFLYRPLVYNFLDHKFGKRLSLFLVPIYISLIWMTSLYYNQSNYFNFIEPSGQHISNSLNYEDMLVDDSDFIQNIAINSKVINDSYIKVFIVFDKSIEDEIYKFNPKLKLDEDTRGITSEMSSINSGTISDASKSEYMTTFNSLYSIEIDTTLYKTDFVLGKTVKKQNGFETYIGVKNLDDGKHILHVKRKELKASGTLSKTAASIPFWYYPN